MMKDFVRVVGLVMAVILLTLVVNAVIVSQNNDIDQETNCALERAQAVQDGRTPEECP